MTVQISDFYRGDTKAFNVTFKDKDGLPIDITGHELWFTMKRKVSDADAEAVRQKRVVFPSDVDSEQGKGAILLSSEETNVPPGTYLFDFQKVIPGNPPEVKTVLAGRIRVASDITRSVA